MNLAVVALALCSLSYVSTVEQNNSSTNAINNEKLGYAKYFPYPDDHFGKGKLSPEIRRCILKLFLKYGEIRKYPHLIWNPKPNYSGFDFKKRWLSYYKICYKYSNRTTTAYPVKSTTVTTEEPSETPTDSGESTTESEEGSGGNIIE